MDNAILDELKAISAELRKLNARADRREAADDIITAAQACKLLGGIGHSALSKGFRAARISNGKYSLREIEKIRANRSDPAYRAARAEIAAKKRKAMN